MATPSLSLLFLFCLPIVLATATPTDKNYPYPCECPQENEIRLHMYLHQFPACTTGIRGFAECLGHSAKPRLHSAKALPSVILGKGHSERFRRQRRLCRVPGTRQTKKHSAKRSTRQNINRKKSK
jgi:hypothetical protein